MGRVETIFEELRTQKRRALMPFICAGHPRPGLTSLILPALERAGASIVEIGFPFSDPIADGPVIAAAMHEALKAGARVEALLDEIKPIRPWLKCGLVAMVSVSIVHRSGGPDAFAGKLARAGFDGMILPDVPVEEAQPFADAAKNRELSFSLLISPTTSLSRAERIVKMSTGFVYLLSRIGLTGESQGTPDLSGKVSKLRELTSLPVVVGFGISTPDQVRAVTAYADGAIVGSALVRHLTDAAKTGKDVVAEAESFTRRLVDGLSVGERQPGPPQRSAV